MNVTAYCHGWVGAGVAAALLADPDIDPTFVLYPEASQTDEFPCPSLKTLVYHYFQLGHLGNPYRWPAKPSIDGVDAVVTANWRHILEPERYKTARLGGFNIHNSLLPFYKGRRPLQRALEDRRELVGYTIHLLTSKIDSGRVLHQRGLLHDGAGLDVIYPTFGLLAGHDLLRVLKEQQNARLLRNKT